MAASATFTGTWNTVVDGFAVATSNLMGAEIPAAWTLDGDVGIGIHTLQFVASSQFVVGGLVRLQLTSSATEDTLKAAALATMVITVTTGDDTVTITGVSNQNGPYVFTPSNSAEVTAFVNARSQGEAVSVTLTATA